MKNTFLKTTSWIMGAVAVVAVLFVENPVMFMVLCLSLGWLGFFWWANDWFEEK